MLDRPDQACVRKLPTHVVGSDGRRAIRGIHCTAWLEFFVVLVLYVWRWPNGRAFCKTIEVHGASARNRWHNGACNDLFPLPLALCASLFAVLALLLGRFASAQEAPLQFLGEFDIPNGAIVFEDTTVGGLSGLAYDARRNVYYAISDDRGDLATGRFYTLRITLGLNGIRDVQVVGVTFLDSDAGEPGAQPYERNALDAEESCCCPTTRC